MAHKTCSMCGQEVEESFESYLKENVMTLGTYKYEDCGCADIQLSEFGDGEGFICKKDIRRAVEDDNVEVWGVMDGSLQLRDTRFE